MMAHECPECGETCYCGTDIDDLLLDRDEDVIACVHWMMCEREEDFEDDYEDEEESED